LGHIDEQFNVLGDHITPFKPTTATAAQGPQHPSSQSVYLYHSAFPGNSSGSIPAEQNMAVEAVCMFAPVQDRFCLHVA